MLTLRSQQLPDEVHKCRKGAILAENQLLLEERSIHWAQSLGSSCKSLTGSTAPTLDVTPAADGSQTFPFKTCCGSNENTDFICLMCVRGQTHPPSSSGWRSALGGRSAVGGVVPDIITYTALISACEKGR